MISDNDRDGAKLIADAYKRWADMPPVTLHINREDLFAIIMALQATTRLSGLGDPMAKRMTGIGRILQEPLCDDAELYAITEAGWNPAYDVDPER